MQLYNVKYTSGIIALSFILLFVLQVTPSFAQKTITDKNLTKPPQNNPAANPILKNDSTNNELTLDNDTSNTKKKTTKVIVIDTLKMSKDSLDAPLKYKAQDSGVLVISTKEFLLYGKSNVQQKAMNLDAGVIKYNGSDQTVRAFGAMDSSNNPLNKVKMQDGTNTTYCDTMDFNFKTQKARAVNSYYTEGELFVNAQVLKKIDSNSFYGYKGRFTTCNLDVPHFAFRTRKMKMINNKIAVSGPASPEFEGVPIPIGIPFGIYPLSRGRHSGILAPQFTTTEDFGIGLQGLGYYKVLSENADAKILADLYSYGGYSINLSSKYIVRYKYNGGFNISFINTKAVNRSSTINDEFTQNKQFEVAWNHQRDNKARPGTSFMANVKFGSTQYNKYNIANTLTNFNNRVNSSIGYTKDYRGKANLSLNATHDQNAATRLVNVQLPNIAFNVQTIYPFQKKESVGKAKWYENIGIGYNNSFTNGVSFYDSAVSFKHLIDTIRWHASHRIPIGLSLPPLGPITIGPSISYGEEWWDRSYTMAWNKATKKVDTSYGKAFLRDVQTSFGISLATRIFGTYLFKHSKSIKALRHEIRPSVGFNYTPNLASRNNFSLQVDSIGHYKRVSKFTGSEVFSEASHGSISFGVNNSFELKVKNKQDTSKDAKDRKIRLFDLNVTSSYNLAADSFALQPFAISLTSNLFEKINISASTSLDPYVYDSLGFKKNKFAWNQSHFSLGRLTVANITMGTQFKSKPIDDKKAKTGKLPNDPYMTPDEQQRQLDYARTNPAEFTDFNIPWTLTLNYSLTFSSVFNTTQKAFKTTSTSNVNFNGDFNLSPKWKMGGQGSYSFTSSSIQNLTFFLSREMHCWQMTINVTPVNVWRSFSITINPKSGILRDLKINRTRTFNNQY